MSDQPENDEVSKENLLYRTGRAWNDLQAYIGSLSGEQLTQLTDAAGWTVKDHLIHMAIWEKGALAILNKQLQRESMDIDAATWESGTDATNAVIQQRHHDMPLDEVLQTLRQHHQSLVDKLNAMTIEDLLLPHSDYQADSTKQDPVFWWVVGNAGGHFREHIPWIKAIAEQS